VATFFLVLGAVIGMGVIAALGVRLWTRTRRLDRDLATAADQLARIRRQSTDK
jgi:predicted signal transduction protein with EAL and GGDEF domain